MNTTTPLEDRVVESKGDWVVTKNGRAYDTCTTEKGAKKMAQTLTRQGHNASYRSTT